jgi:uncharacterized membrane protein
MASFSVSLQADTPGWIKTSEWGIALGRFHPMVLHLPIGCFVAVFFLEIMSLLRKQDYKSSIVFVWGLTAFTALLASSLGWLLSADGYGEGAVERHENTALIFTGLCFVCWIWRLKSGVVGWKFRGVILLTLLVMGIAGHEGGNLTHGEHYLFEKMPEHVRGLFMKVSSAPLEDWMDTGVGDRSAIAVLQDRCSSCHGEKKQKGDYRLDSRVFALQPGESEEVPIVPGDAMSSYLVRLITYHEDEDEVMPPAKKKPLSSEEILKIIQWIDDGAKWDL